MVFASVSDDEVDVATADAAFGAKGFGTCEPVAAGAGLVAKEFGIVEVSVVLGASKLPDAIAGLGEKRSDAVDPSLRANGFGVVTPDVLPNAGVVLGGERLDV